MTPQSVIRRKRDGEALSELEVEAFVGGVVSGDWSPGQTGAMLMAFFQRGLDLQETRLLLQNMLQSGDTLDMAGLDRPVADKHSTGGVGDKVSLVLAPLAAACGLAVPMLSGRGLGITGGTLDKLESIPGFRVARSAEEIRSQVESVGCVMAGQTDAIVPADKILYAMRDETCTVENPSLIAASILSKKLAEGLDALLLDVKFGSGAFFNSLEEARILARLMVDLGKAAGCRVAAWLTRMDRPLGRAVGNAVEVVEAVQILKGEGPDGLTDLICQEVAGMLVLCGTQDTFEDALQATREGLASGRALDCFRAMVLAQEGDPEFINNPACLPQATHVTDILYEEPEPVWVSEIDARQIAEIVLETGAGRRRSEDTVDHSVGLSSMVVVGERLEPGDLLVRLHHANPEKAPGWEERFRQAVSISEQPVDPESLICERIG